MKYIHKSRIVTCNILISHWAGSWLFFYLLSLWNLFDTAKLNRHIQLLQSFISCENNSLKIQRLPCKCIILISKFKSHLENWFKMCFDSSDLKTWASPGHATITTSGLTRLIIILSDWDNRRDSSTEELWDGISLVVEDDILRWLFSVVRRILLWIVLIRILSPPLISF